MTNHTCNSEQILCFMDRKMELLQNKNQVVDLAKLTFWDQPDSLQEAIAFFEQNLCQESCREFAEI